MNLKEMTIEQFSEILASGVPTPGGGSAAAMQGAIGASLTHMVAALTIGKKKYAVNEPLMVELLQETERLRKALIDAIERDAKAFDMVGAVFAMPKYTGEEIAIRKAAMQKALISGTQVPFEVMTLSMETLELMQKAVGRSNTNALSDLGVAALSMKAAVQGAWLNILINISEIADESVFHKYRTEGEAILNRAVSLAEAIYEEIISSIHRHSRAPSNHEERD